MKKILVIDDDEYLRTDLLDILAFEGYEALGAENGRVGILSAREQLPQAIICDINMPVFDGFEVIRILCQDPQTAGIPVIFLSAYTYQPTVQNGLQLGTVACLSKPYNLAELLTAVRTMIGD